MQLQVLKKQIKLQEWSQMVMACRNSGLDIKTWCEQNNINYKTYYYRQRRVFEALPESANKQSLAFPSATETVDFVPIRPTPLSSNQVTLHLSKCTLEIPEGYDPETLRTILQVLREC